MSGRELPPQLPKKPATQIHNPLLYFWHNAAFNGTAGARILRQAGADTITAQSLYGVPVEMSTGFGNFCPKSPLQHTHNPLKTFSVRIAETYFPGLSIKSVVPSLSAAAHPALQSFCLEQFCIFFEHCLRNQSGGFSAETLKRICACLFIIQRQCLYRELL